jgi:hypothetical protein
MSELMNKAYNTADVALMENGRLTQDDIPYELLRYISEGMRLQVGSEFLRDGLFPFPLPEYFNNAKLDGNRVVYEDIIDIELLESDADAGDIPEIEYEDDPFLEAGAVSTRRRERLEGELKNIFSQKGVYERDRTKGVTPPLQEMNIPEQVKQDPLGADFTGQMRPVDE